MGHHGIAYIAAIVPRHPHPTRSAGRRPLVAVTATVRDDAGVARVRLTALYVRALERVGLTPVVVPSFGSSPSDEEEAATRAANVLESVSGLLLTGGEDVAPAFYGATPSPHIKSVSAQRDATEIALVRGARDREVPMLAICRGIQVANVALGGTLIQDIPSERPGSLDHDPDGDRGQRIHPLHVDPGSRIASALNETDFQVNSVHHQAVDCVAPGLHVTARAPDGIIEGLEPPATDPWWAVCVQWHPEEFVDERHAPDLGLFAAFAQATKATAFRPEPDAGAGQVSCASGTDTRR
jgi:putative glutamine amidotransferase